MSKQFQLDYIDVASRIVEFRTKHPEGSLQQAALDFKEVAGAWWVVYTAAAYRSPDDPRPGIGTAWEPVPGKTNFTRDSELQNAETAAWGRAIVAALAADTKRGIASAEEVRNRQEQVDPIVEARVAVAEAWKANRGEFDRETVEKDYSDWAQGELLSNAVADRLYQYADHLKQEAGA